MKQMHPSENSDTSQGIFKAIRRSLSLIAPRDRLKLGIVSGLQMSTAMLDLVGVLLIGLVTAIALSGSGSSTSGLGQSLGKLVIPFKIPTDAQSVLVLAGAAGVLLVLKSLLNIALTRITLGFLARRQVEVSGGLSSQLLHSSISEIQKRTSQETAYAMTTGVNFALLMVLGQAGIGLSEIVLLAVLTVGLMVVNPVVTIFALVFFLATAFVLHRILATRVSRLGELSAVSEISSVAAIQEAIGSYRELAVSNRITYYVEVIQQHRRSAATVQADLSIVGVIPKYIFEIALIVGGGILVYTQILTSSLSAALVMIALFLVAGSRIVPSILRLQSAILVIRASSAQASPTYRLAAELHFRPEIANRSREQKYGFQGRTFLTESGTDFVSHVEVRNVTFTYPESRVPALIEVSLDVLPGESVALAGPTGSGKSTLADIILGVLEPDSGNVQLSRQQPGAAIRRWPGSVGYVPQQVAMANGTIRRNVALGIAEEEIDDSLVWQALERARLGELLKGSREGLETLVGEQGVKLSGGQRQRLGIARALYTQPRLLVLDEATSALDAETENSIVQTLSDLHGDITLLTIAHRLGSIVEADKVVYLEAGRILAQGTFEDVRRAAPGFDEQAKFLRL